MKIFIPVKPISLNACETTSGKFRHKSTRWKIWKKQIDPFLEEHSLKLSKFANEFDSTKKIEASYVFNLDNMLVKGGERKGKINLRAGDIDNFVKPITDVLFKKMAEQNPFIEDAHIIKMTVEKKQTKNSGMHIEYKLIW